MKLDQLKDSNGTSLQSYADTLIEKCQETGTVGVIILANEELFLITNIGDMTAVPGILKKMAIDMQKPPKFSEFKPRNEA